MEAVQLSLFELSEPTHIRTWTVVKYLNLVWWDNIVHGILSALSFWVTLFAIVIATSTGMSDSRREQYVESILGKAPPSGKGAR